MTSDEKALSEFRKEFPYAWISWEEKVDYKKDGCIGINMMKKIENFILKKLKEKGENVWKEAHERGYEFSSRDIEEAQAKGFQDGITESNHEAFNDGIACGVRDERKRILGLPCMEETGYERGQVPYSNWIMDNLRRELKEEINI